MLLVQVHSISHAWRRLLHQVQRIRTRWAQLLYQVPSTVPSANFLLNLLVFHVTSISRNQLVFQVPSTQTLWD